MHLRLMSDEQPCPLQVVVATVGHVTIITRKWSNSDGDSCRLCSNCTFQPGEDGTGVCLVATTERMSADKAATFGDLD